MAAILGISAFYHDSAAALLIDGEISAAAQEERFSRRKHDERFPGAAIRFCLDAAGIKPSEIDHVAIAKDPNARLMRKAVYALRMPSLALERVRAWKKFAGVKEEVSQALGVSR